jgi:broad-specificity NMP kinase
MRIGISGAHGTGKTTLVEDLCAHLAGHVPVDEPYFLLEEEGYEFEFPPSLEDYRAQLRRSLHVLRSSAPKVVSTAPRWTSWLILLRRAPISRTRRNRPPCAQPWLAWIC